MSHGAIEPWGKLARDGARLTLVAHCIDVAAVARALLELPTWRRRLEALAGRTLGDLDLDRLTILAFWHDVGKAGAGFYAKALSEPERTEWHRRYGAAQGGHTRVVAPLLGEEGRYKPHRDRLGIDILWQWAGGDPVRREAFCDLWLAAVSHHGEPLSLEALRGAGGAYPTWMHGIAGYEPLDGLACLGAAARCLWPAAFDDPTPVDSFAESFTHAFAGLVSLADWIGSNADEARLYFPYDLGPQDERRWEIALRRARDVLRRMRIDVEELRADLRRRAPSFESVFPFAPSPVQVRAADRWGQLVIVEAETGSGKTEAALWRFKSLFEAGEVDALCFLLPTRVAATSIARRIDEFIAALFPDPAARPNTVLAVPGYLRANGDDGTRLAPFHVLWPDRGDDRAPLYWAAENSKRYFAAAAAAGTVDQFLLSALQTRHSHLRGSVLLRSFVVVDEVHASDRYMRVVLTTALRRHLLAGGHSMLLSATLTADVRDGEFLALARSRRPSVEHDAGTAPLQEADYPRISSPGHTPWVGRITGNKRIRHHMEPMMRNPAAVAAMAMEAANAGARVLVLRNTVRQAVATQRAIESQVGTGHAALFRCAGVACTHHGRYAFSDRQALDAAVTDQFGKAAARRERPVVLCATQTVEISVDCDADFMITDLAPMDVLLQRLGRLHRHADRRACRPPGYGEPRCIILLPPDADFSRLMTSGGSRGLGLGPRSAYPDVLALEATRRALLDAASFPVLDIPRHNRALVERTCGAAALARLAEDLGGPWNDHLAEATGRAAAQGQHAQTVTVDWERPWREAEPGEMSMDVRTRLGLDGIDLELSTPWDSSPFGHRIERLTLPAWMLPSNGVLDAVPTAEAVEYGRAELRFRVRGRAFVYDRLGLAVDDDAQ